MYTLVLILFVASVAPRALCQDSLVETRATNSEKAMLDGGGQSRTIYSQARPLSPHRMMHFGKRRVSQNPLLSVDIEDLDSLHQLKEATDYFPDRFARSMEEINNKYGANGGYQIFVSPGERQLLELMLQRIETRPPSDNLLYNLEVPLALRPLLQQVASARNYPKSLKMMQVSGNEQNEDTSGVGRVAEQQADDQSQRTAANRQEQIDVNTRSLIPSGMNSLTLPTAYFKSLYERLGSPAMLNYGSFNKKSEPKHNMIMHFGRK